MNTAVADCRVTIQITQMTGRSASVSAIVFAWDFAEHFSMIGSSAFGWRRTPARVHRTLRLVPTHRAPHRAAADRSQRGRRHLCRPGYGGYKGFPGFTFTGGRMPNPFVRTLMVWDDDINPEGLAEQWKHTFTIGGGAAEPASYSKDGKNVAPPPPAEPLVKIDRLRELGSVCL